MSGQNELKREAIRRMLEEHPELTNRATAKEVEMELGIVGARASLSHPLVARVRKELEEEGIIPHIDPTERFESDGRRARGRRGHMEIVHVPGVIVLFTFESEAQIKEQGGSGNWAVDPNRVSRYPYAILTRNRNDPKAPDDVEHKHAFLVGRIAGTQSTGKFSRRGHPLYVVKLRDCAPIRTGYVSFPGQNSVWYTDLATLDIDESDLEFSSTSQGPAVNTKTKQPDLDLGAIRQQLARAFGVPPTAVEITIRL